MPRLFVGGITILFLKSITYLIGIMYSSLLQTVRFKNELERNITIKLGYAKAKIYKCEDENYPPPMC